MQLHRRQETSLDLSVRNTMALKVRLKETVRTFFCFEDGSRILKTVIEVPATQKLEAFSLDGFLSFKLSFEAIGNVLRGSFSDDRKERYIEVGISYLVHVHAKEAAASEVDTVALKAEFEVMIDILEPSEKCMVCLVEFQPREAVDRKPCGHAYHEDCTEYYIKRNIDCPTCYYEPESSSKSSSHGAREFASDQEYIIIEVSCDFPNTDDDESEEEGSDEPGEMCMGCLAEFRPKEVVERKPCGHTYHEDCSEYYIKHHIHCPMCYYNEPASSSKSCSGAREFTSEEDIIIKEFSDFLNIDDDETEEEAGSDESAEMCMVCHVEFGPREMVKRMPCGHVYHEDCMEYYIEHDIDCPTCYYDDPASSSKSSIGDFSCTNDDESEEESCDKSSEMCMVCLVEFQPWEAVERKPCGHVYHEDCLDYYIEHDIECPMCYYDISF